MFKHFRLRQKKKAPETLDPEVAGALATLLITIVGETVKGRMARAVCAALIAGLTAYLAPGAKLPEWSSEQQAQASSERVPEASPVEPSTRQAPPHSVTGAAVLDSPRTEVHR